MIYRTSDLPVTLLGHRLDTLLTLSVKMDSILSKGFGHVYSDLGRDEKLWLFYDCFSLNYKSFGKMSRSSSDHPIFTENSAS